MVVSDVAPYDLWGGTVDGVFGSEGVFEFEESGVGVFSWVSVEFGGFLGQIA